MSAVTITGLRNQPLSLDEVLQALDDPSAGGLCVFIGRVRNHDQDRSVTTLDYSAHPSAERALREVAEKVSRGHPDVRLAAVHRVGHLAVGDLAVIVAAAAPHRAQAFAGARELIDVLKAQVPIWKRQSFEDGETQWVGLP